MTPADLDLNLLVAFDALARERSVTRAAARLGIGQPATSAALARLRRAFGDPLFVRAPGGLRPTPKALRMAPAVADALDRVRGILDAERAFDPAAARDAFVIAGTDYTSVVLLPPLVAAVRAAAPQVDLRVIGYDKDEVGTLLDRGTVDAVLGVFPDPDPRFVRRPLFTERFVGVARHDHPVLSGGPIDAARWAALPHALVSINRDASGAIDGALRRQGLERRIALVLPHMLALPAVLARGDLVAALPARVALSLGDPRLATFDLPVPVPGWEVAMLWNPSARNDLGRRWLRTSIAGVAAAL